MNPDWRVYVISARRPGNVPAMTAHLGPTEPVTWVVPDYETSDYRLAGAEHVIGVPEPPPGRYSLPCQRNAAQKHATDNGVICIQTDDDLRRLCYLDRPESATSSWKGAKRLPITWATARARLITALRTGTGAALAGVNPTSNVLDAASKPELSDHGFVVAALCAIDTTRPGLPTWDETLPLKEDYDYTCRHLETYGITRVNWLVTDYAYCTNRGGAVTIRTPELEQRLADTLVDRWPQYLRPHARRPGEVSFIPRRRGKQS